MKAVVVTAASRLGFMRPEADHEVSLGLPTTIINIVGRKLFCYVDLKVVSDINQHSSIGPCWPVPHGSNGCQTQLHLCSSSDEGWVSVSSVLGIWLSISRGLKLG